MSQAPQTPPTFAQFALSAEVLKGVEEAGFKVPSPIQAQAIPVILGGRDLIARAQTGTGKTAAFGLPAMSRMRKVPGVQILVITPTRELAAQVADELYRLGRFANVRTAAVYGGQSSWRQVEMVARGAQVVVATPGRLLDLLGSKRLGTFAPSTVVIDEADEMLDMGFLDMGFLEDIQEIFKHLPAERQTLMFSATMPPQIAALAKNILKNPATIDLTATDTFKTDVEQFFYVIEESERRDAVIRLIDTEEPGKALVFCRTKRETDELTMSLVSRGCIAKAIHGDLDQRQRTEAIGAFKRGDIEILVATDVAARGLDVSNVTHVFNYHMPFDQEAYVHRIGRTGRAGAHGKAITLVTPFEFRKLRRIQHAIKASFIHGEIPSIADVHKQHDAKLIAALCKQPVNEAAVDILSGLSEEMDVTEAACKLISLLLSQRKVRGPARIGVPKEKVERMVSGDREQRHQGHKPWQKKKPYYKKHSGPPPRR
jgi:ATP-dependent RNA helicase DeaD